MSALLLQVGAAFFATIAFALLFGVPGKYNFLCGVTGALGWLVYLLLGKADMPSAFSVFVATAVVALLSRLFSVKACCPVTVFLISGIIPLVPGSSVYWATFYLVTNDTTQAFASGFLAVRIAIAMVLGIVVIFELPKSWFFGRRKK